MMHGSHKEIEHKEKEIQDIYNESGKKLLDMSMEYQRKIDKLLLEIEMLRKKEGDDL